jgi:hypothetical protein
VTGEVFALQRVVGGGARELGEELEKARDALVDLVGSAGREYRRLSQGYVLFAEGVSTKVLWQEHVRTGESALEYFGEIVGAGRGAPEEVKVEEKVVTGTKIREMLADIKCRADISRMEYTAICSYLETQLDAMVVSIGDTHRPLVQEMAAQSSGLLAVISRFPDEHRALRKRLKAENTNAEFVGLFEGNFKEKSIRAIDELFFFFEIFQRTLKETILESVVVWQREYQVAMGNINTRLDDCVKYLTNQKKVLAKVRASCSTSSLDLTLAERSQIIDRIEEVQIEMSKGVLLIAGEISNAIKFSFEFSEKTLNSLVKVFDALSSHADSTIEASPGDGEAPREDKAKIDVFDEDVREYFVVEAELASFIKGKREAQKLGGQLIFESNLDEKVLQAGIENVVGPWLDLVAPYLYPIDDFKDILARIAAISGSASSKKMMMSPEINLLVEMTDEDTTMASLHKYSTRMNKSGVPNNGTLMLMGEFMVFFAKTITSNINLLVPYRCIKQLVPIKNFLGKGNGLQLQSHLGNLEFFVGDSKERDTILNRIQLSVDSLRHTCQTALFKALVFRDTVVIEEENDFDRKTIPIECRDKARMLTLRTAKKIKVGYFDSHNPIKGQRIEKSSLFALLSFWFSSESFILLEREYPSFQHYWKDQCGASDFSFLMSLTPIKLQIKDSFAETFETFLAQSSYQQLVMEYTIPGVGRVVERLFIYFSHADQIEITIQATCPDKTVEFEGILVLSQGGHETVEIENLSSVYASIYWKQGVKLFSNAEILFGSKYLEAMNEMATERRKFLENKESRFKL